ncbi:hypothetical protein HYQ40_00120 [Aerococcaceae bacterium DSM 111021]|nr:hypothetical protein [Aerococcaceae bacterium DSM 111021]
MKFITRFLKNPFVKIFFSPLASILFGLIIGASQAESTRWIPMLLLYIIVVFAQLVDHFLYLQVDKETPEVAPNILLYVFDGILLISAIIFMLSSHWIINALLIFYIIFIHVQYMPFKMTGTIYHFILSVFFNGFILNVIAFNSQTFAVTQPFLINTIPIVLIFIGLTLEVFNLKNLIINYQPITVFKRFPQSSLVFGAIALMSGFYFSLPSSTFFIVQILFVVLSAVTMLPLLVNTQQEKQAQNKMNYMHAVTVIFTLLYSLSHLY